jgi:hypothetical protein
MKKSEEPNYQFPASRFMFVSHKDTIKRGDKIIGRMISATMAKRTANALNRYTPGVKGY